MPYSPPRWLDVLGARLVPPASAEHALGDLAECSRSRGDYVRNLASILPRVVWSQVRRRATIGGIVFHALLTAIILMAFQGMGASRFFAEPWAPLRLAAVGSIWVIGCALAAAYGPRDKPALSSVAVCAGTCVAAVGAAALLGVPLLRVVMGLSVVYATVLALSMPWLTRIALPPLSPETLVVHAHRFQRGIWWRNARESIACVAVIGFNLRAVWKADSALSLAGPLLLVAGVVFVMGFLHLRAGSRTVPADADVKMIWQFHRGELVRQRDILRAIAWWYLMPFVPGMLMTSAPRWATAAPAAIGGLVGVAVVFAVIWRLNLWGAAWLDGELKKVDALEVQL